MKSSDATMVTDGHIILSTLNIAYRYQGIQYCSTGTTTPVKAFIGRDMLKLKTQSFSFLIFFKEEKHQQSTQHF